MWSVLSNKRIMEKKCTKQLKCHVYEMCKATKELGKQCTKRLKWHINEKLEINKKSCIRNVQSNWNVMYKKSSKLLKCHGNEV